MQGVTFACQFFLLTADFHFFQLCQVTEFQVEDGIGLPLAEFEALHQHRPWLVLTTDDRNNFIDIEVRNQQAIEDMQAVEHLVEAVLQTPGHCSDTELQPFLQQGTQILDSRAPVQTDHVHIDPVAAFQIRGCKQVQHDGFDIDPAGTRHDDQPGRVLVVGFITQISNHRQLFRCHLCGNLLQYPRAGHLPG